MKTHDMPEPRSNMPEPHSNEDVHSGNSYLTRASIFDRLAEPAPAVREMAWREFRKRYSPVIAGFASKCGASRQDIDDVIQEVMASFLSASGEFVYDPSKGRFRGYLKTCTVRASVRLAGKNMKVRGIPLADVGEADLAVEPIWNDVWERQQVAQALRIVRQEFANTNAIRTFEQYVLLDRSAEVVAKELDTTVNNVHQSKSRITKRLREIVQHLKADVGE